MSTTDKTSCGCETANPLQRDGTSQAQRLLKALDPAYVSVDERTPEDMFRFALKYAEQLNYYNLNNEADGNWLKFLQRDASMLVALIAGQDTDTYKTDFDNTFAQLKTTPLNDPQIPVLYAELYRPIIRILKQIGQWFELCDPQISLYRDLEVYFQSIFNQGLLRLRELDKGAVVSSLLSTEQLVAPFDFLPSSWQDQVVPDVDVNANSLVFSGFVEHKFKALAGASYLQSILDEFINTLNSIIDRVPQFMEESLERFPYHKAHTALFISFIELFVILQKHLNKLTARHLDFYYERVLQLAHKPAVADQVHVIFELAKTVVDKNYFLPENTLLKAGKDRLGKPMVYATDDDIILNRAQAVDFRSMYIDRNEISEGVFCSAVYAAPVANSKDGQGEELDPSLPQWKAFGESQVGKTTSTTTMQDAALGWAFASHQLILGEGRREIHVCFRIHEDITADIAAFLRAAKINATDEIQLTDFFSCDVTSKKAWTKLSWAKTNSIGEAQEPIFINNMKIVFRLLLETTDPATAAWNADNHGGNYNTTWPVLRICLKNVDLGKNDKGIATVHASNLYDILTGISLSADSALNKPKGIHIETISIDVDVKHVRNLIIQNDQFKINPAKPFQPFGVLAPQGASWYIGSEEIFYKQLHTLKFDIQWNEVPEQNLANHYADYDKVLGRSGSTLGTSGSFTKITSNSVFTVQLEHLSDREWKPYKGFGDQGTETSVTTLFDKDDAKKPSQILIRDPRRRSPIFDRKKATNYPSLTEYQTDVQKGFIRLVLNGVDFQHKNYANALMQASVVSADNPTLKLLINPPYTPSVKSMEAHYTSKHKLIRNHDQFFHLHPFGEAEQTVPMYTGDKKDAPENTQLLLPEFVYRKTDTIYSKASVIVKDITRRCEGMLFIGLKELQPQQSVSMLVQVVEDSGNPDRNVPEISWSYLRKNEWVQLSQSEVITDSTNGFITSGLIELSIPADASSSNTLMPSGLHWLRASTVLNETTSDADEYTSPGDTLSLCNVLSIQTQAVRAKFIDNKNDPQHLESVLSAETITKLENSDSAIKSVKQPFASFGGKMAETATEYRRRVSERLRHKERAITLWDYERIVLENFPSIYKVKAINHTRYASIDGQACYTEYAPGNVCVTVVSNLRNQNQINPLKPSTSIGTREAIRDLLISRTSMFANIQVINPSYEEIYVECKIQFGKAYQSDSGYYRNILVEDLKRFLSPWAYDDGFDVVFGGKIHMSYILNFIEEREYVDYVTDFFLFQVKDEIETGEKISIGPLETISASNARSILVSSDTHNIYY